MYTYKRWFRLWRIFKQLRIIYRTAFETSILKSNPELSFRLQRATATMKFSSNCILLFTLSCLKSSYALPMVERDEPHVNPIAHVPVSATLRTAVSITPNVHILKKADLLTEGTVVPGFLGPEPNITATAPQKRDIIGPDNRYLQTKTGNPWNYIGSFAWQVGSDGYRCSGALVGPRHLATARHCYNTTNNAITYNFRPNYDQGTRGFTTAQVTNVMFVPGTLTDTCSYGDDWVIMILNQRIGDQYGYFGVRNYDGSKANQGFFHEGMYIPHQFPPTDTLLTAVKAIPSISATRSVHICKIVSAPAWLRSATMGVRVPSLLQLMLHLGSPEALCGCCLRPMVCGIYMACFLVGRQPLPFLQEGMHLSTRSHRPGKTTLKLIAYEKLCHLASSLGFTIIVVGLLLS